MYIQIIHLPHLCVLLVWFPNYGHWVVYYNGKFYDTELGLMDECAPNGRIGAYLSVYLDERNENE